MGRITRLIENGRFYTDLGIDAARIPRPTAS